MKYFAFGKNFDFEGGEYGLALLSRYPISNITTHRIFNERRKECIVLQAVVSFFSQKINVFVTHFPSNQYEDNSPARQIASQFILDLISKVEGPVIFGGDLNATSDKPEIVKITANIAGLLDAWSAAPQERDHCDPRIDYVFFRGPYVVRRYEAPCWPLNETYLPKYEKPECPLKDVGLSDHPFVLTRFEIVNAQ